MSARIAVTHDYLTQRGGAERVALTIRGGFGGSVLYTSIYDPGRTFPEFRHYDIQTSALQRIAVLRADPRRAFALLPHAFDRMQVGDADAMVCSSTGFAHGINTEAKKIVYCHNPPRWLYQTDEYLRGHGRAVGTALRLLRPRLLTWDQAAAATATTYLVNSSVVRERVRSAYGIDAIVVPPPVSLDADGPRSAVAGVEPGFFLVIGRPRGYKNVEVVCAAFRELPAERLVVVGGLPPEDADGAWPSNVSGLVDLSDEQLRWLYSQCRAVVAASYEDFGLTPVEGYAFGKPAVVLRAGGFLDTTIEGVTGTFINEVRAAAVADGVQALIRQTFPVAPILQHVMENYTRDVFQKAISRAVSEALAG